MTWQNTRDTWGWDLSWWSGWEWSFGWRCEWEWSFAWWSEWEWSFGRQQGWLLSSPSAARWLQRPPGAPTQKPIDKRIFEVWKGSPSLHAKTDFSSSVIQRGRWKCELWNNYWPIFLHLEVIFDHEQTQKCPKFTEKKTHRSTCPLNLVTQFSKTRGCQKKFIWLFFLYILVGRRFPYEQISFLFLLFIFKLILIHHLHVNPCKYKWKWR